ncbi:MAG: energy-coupling factor transporter transmembrane component T [Hominenteromicrobium sp.]
MGFECFHPAINLIYFVSVLLMTVLFRHPAFLMISCLSAFAYSVWRNGRRAAVYNLCLLPAVLLFALYYWSYHHFGVTVLYRNFIGNCMTLEALLYGLTLGLQAAAAVMWMSCAVSVFTTDKVVYLLGRVSPRLSLFLSVFLRMAPRAGRQAVRIAAARKGLGRGPGQGSVFRRMRNCLKWFSMLVTWLLESLADVSAAMRSRGGALPGRTAFSIYRFDGRDRGFVLGFAVCLTGVLMAALLGQTNMIFDPRIIMMPVTPMLWVFCAVYAALCLMPMGVEIVERICFERQKKRIQAS